MISVKAFLVFLLFAFPTETVELRGRLLQPSSKKGCAKTTVLLRLEDQWFPAALTDRKGRFTLTYPLGTRPEPGEQTHLFYLYAIRRSGDTTVLDSFATFPTGAAVGNDTEPVRATFYLRR